MSKIRSALEIALERTDSVESNPEKLREEQFTQEGQRMFSRYFFEKELSVKDVKETLSSYEARERSYVMQGFVQTMLANLTLPSNDLYVESMGSIKEAAALLSSKPSEVTSLFIQIDGFFQQYLQQTEQLKNSLIQQYGPKLKQKQQQLAKQFGAVVDLTPEQDPEFLDLLHRHQQDLDHQYQTVLNDIKQKIMQLILA